MTRILYANLCAHAPQRGLQQQREAGNDVMVWSSSDGRTRITQRVLLLVHCYDIYPVV